MNSTPNGYPPPAQLAGWLADIINDIDQLKRIVGEHHQALGLAPTDAEAEQLADAFQHQLAADWAHRLHHALIMTGFTGYAEGFTRQIVAEVMGISGSAASKQLKRAVNYGLITVEPAVISRRRMNIYRFRPEGHRLDDILRDRREQREKSAVDTSDSTPPAE